MMRSCYFLIGVLAIAGCAHQAEPADLIVHNAQIQSVNATMEVFQAMAIRDGVILELGPERYILNKYRATEKIDAATRPVYPGLIDGHCHFLGYGLGLQQADLVGTRSEQEVIERLENHQRQYPSQWVQGRGWDQNDWENTSFPSAAVLDASFPEQPVCLQRIDGHAIWVNAVALEMAGVNAELANGREDILVLPDGSPSGVLLDNACALVEGLIPEPDETAKRRALLEAQQDCFEVGLTTVAIAGLPRADLELIDAMHQSGALNMRVYAMVSDSPEDLDYYTSHGPVKTDRLNIRSFKFYADGALGSRGACLLAPYSDLSGKGDRGFLLDSLGHYRAAARRLHDAGFQMNTHCIGDSANRAILGVYAEVLEGENDRRWRIEHAQVVHRKDQAQFSSFSVVPSIQPTHATSDMYWAEQRLGRNRIRRAYAYRSLKDQIGFVALGTDFPVEGISPFATYYAACVRKDAKGFPDGGFMMDEALNRRDALRGMTIWNALAQFEEAEKGSLEPGKLADFVILDRDLLLCPDERILGTNVLLTAVGGEVVLDER